MIITNELLLDIIGYLLPKYDTQDIKDKHYFGIKEKLKLKGYQVESDNYYECPYDSLVGCDMSKGCRGCNENKSKEYKLWTKKNTKSLTNL